jgi:hypothetical protein
MEENRGAILLLPTAYLPMLYARHHHHHQPINVPTAGAKAFLMDGTRDNTFLITMDMQVHATALSILSKSHPTGLWLKTSTITICLAQNELGYIFCIRI